MMALMSLGWVLEVRLGSLHLVFTTITLTFISSLLHLLIIFILLDLIGWTDAMWTLNACGAGYSGILFAYMILSCHYGPVNQSLFGMYSIPSKFYPWLLLFITAFLFPGSSFLGHLTGIFAGYIFVYAILYTRPFNRFVKWAEQRIVPSRVSAWKCYYSSLVVNTEPDINRPTGNTQYYAPSNAEEPDQLTEMRQESDQNQGTIPRAIISSYRWVRHKLQYLYDRIRGRLTNEQVSNPDYWAGRTDGRTLGTV
jgi:hypothetical protein